MSYTREELESVVKELAKAGYRQSKDEEIALERLSLAILKAEIAKHEARLRQLLEEKP